MPEYSQLRPSIFKLNRVTKTRSYINHTNHVTNKIFKCTHEFVQHPTGREDQRDVGDHEDHRCPIHPEAAGVVIIHDDVSDDGVLDPLHGVGGRIQNEDGQNNPSPFI